MAFLQVVAYKSLYRGRSRLLHGRVSQLEQPLREANPTLDRYDLFAINIASTMLGYVYGQYQRSSTTEQCTNVTGKIVNCQLTPNQDLGVKVAAQVGTLFGQLFFGWLADILGRKKMCECERRRKRLKFITLC